MGICLYIYNNLGTEDGTSRHVNFFSNLLLEQHLLFTSRTLSLAIPCTALSRSSNKLISGSSKAHFKHITFFLLTGEYHCSSFVDFTVEIHEFPSLLSCKSDSPNLNRHF
jgi:hypothetical protein